ncbi:MAG: hypothetical protein ACO3YR_15105, partial [bacterium]
PSISLNVYRAKFLLGDNFPLSPIHSSPTLSTAKSSRITILRLVTQDATSFFKNLCVENKK